MPGSGRTLLAIAAVAGHLLFALPASASAERLSDPNTERPVYPTQWVRVSCATGAMTGYQLEQDETAQPVLRLSGWIQPCHPGEITNGYAVVYFAGERVWRSGLVPYGSMDSPTTVDLSVDVYAGEPTVMCLAFTYGGRLACLSVEPGGPEAPPTVVQIPTDDPRIRLPVTPLEEDMATDPTCGTCA